jgi:streptomycin 6-kinase
VLAALEDRWGLEWGSLVPRGNMSVVVRCRTTQGRRAVLKICPDHKRIAAEAAALQKWTTPHTPDVYAVDESVGALLIEAIEPGIPLDESSTYPTAASLAELLTSLHCATISPSFPPLALRVAELFTSGESDYRRHPGLADLIPLALYDRGRRLATTLATQAANLVPLHGDLTPVNIVQGGTGRGLVALDPAACHGDAAFDTVDLVFWRADDLAAITVRATELGSAIGLDADRLLDWCVAFAAMVALELVASLGASEDRIRTYLDLAKQAPR